MKEQIDLFEQKTDERSGIMHKKYSNPFHSDEEMERLGIDDARKLTGEDHALLLGRVMKDSDAERKEDETKAFEVSLQLISEVIYEISKRRGVKEFSHEEFTELAREIVKTLEGYNFAPSIFSFLKKRPGSAHDAFGSALKERPKFGIEKSLPNGDRDEDRE